MQKNKIEVNHEWGALKEVIVGIGEDIVIASWCPLITFLEPEFIESTKRNGGSNLADIAPDVAKEVIKEVNGLASLLEERGIIVHRPRLLQDEEKTYLYNLQKGRFLLSPRDPVLVIGNNIIECSLKLPFRRKWRYAIRDILQKAAKEGSANYVAIPPAAPTMDNKGPFLEGGDVLLNGYEIYAGCSGIASNEAGIQWLQKFLGPKYKVHTVRLKPDVLHLDCALALVRPGLALICKEHFVEKLPESLRDWDFIDVTKDEAVRLGANGFIIDEKTIIVDAQHPRIAEELRKKELEVITLPYSNIATFGGAFRCAHHPLRRESKLE